SKSQMADTVDTAVDGAMEVVENPDVAVDTQNENEMKVDCKSEIKTDEHVETEGDEHIEEELDGEMEETEEIEEKPEVEQKPADAMETKESNEVVNPYAISNFYPNVAAVDIGKCMIMAGLPSSFNEDSIGVFNDVIVSMLEEDLTVKKESIESISKLNKGEDEENGCRVMVSFKSRVHKHRVMAVKNRSNLGYTLEQVETVPAEVGDLLKVVEKKEDETHDDKEEVKKEEEKKDIEKFKDEHSVLPFVIDWDGAPEFQWKIPEGKAGAVNLVIENATVLDLYEPFLYRASVKAQSIQVKVPGRVIEDQPTAKHFGTITLQYMNDGEAIRFAMVNLIYFRSKGERRIKVYLPQTTNALKRKSEFEKRLGRKIEIPDTMRKMMVKSTDVSLSECTFGVDEAKIAFPDREIESVERVVDCNEKVAFVVTFKTAHETVLAHANNRSIKIGDISCRIYLLGTECNGTEREGKEYLTRLEMIAQTKVEQAKKKEEYEAKVAKGEIVPSAKKTFPKKPVSTPSTRGKRGSEPLGTSKIPINKSNGPSFKTPVSSSRSQRSTAYDKPSPRGLSSVSSSRGGRLPPRPTRRDDVMGGRPSRTSPWQDNGRRNGGGGGGGPLSASAFNKDDYRMEQMVREQRRQMEMQEQILRQQEMITVMSDRLHQPALSSSAFRQRDYELMAPTSLMAGGSRQGYGMPPSVTYNQASGYTPSPAYEPLTASMTPSHLSNTDNQRSSSGYGSSSYGKSSSSYPSSSSYHDRRY
ncbi:hypothetical protein PFISCL1PPCAC_15212, partial [Pristionchus fissidentatus]